MFCSLTATATTYEYKENGNIVFSWQKDDMTTLYTTGGTTIVFWSQSNNSSTTLNAYGWALSPNTTYYASYPFKELYLQNKLPATSLPISYLTQQQTSNDNTAHLSAYDYMTAQATTGDASATFNFNHLGSILRFAIAMPEDVTLTSLTIAADSKSAFITNATMNATNNTLTATAKDSFMTLALNNIEITKGKQLVAYMMMVPGNYANKTLTLTLSTADSKTATTYIRGCEIKQGKAYPVNITTLSDFIPAIGISHDTAAKAQLGKRSTTDTAQPPSVHAGVITYPNAYAPDFLFDTQNVLTEQPLLGDADNDGKLTMDDAKAVADRWLGIGTKAINETKADINCDGQITIDDANEIVNIVLSE